MRRSFTGRRVILVFLRMRLSFTLMGVHFQIGRVVEIAGIAAAAIEVAGPTPGSPDVDDLLLRQAAGRYSSDIGARS